MCLNHKQLETFKQLSYIFNMLLAKYFKESSYSKATAQMFDQLKMSRTTCDLAVVLWSLLWSLLWSGCGVAAYGGVGSTAWLSTFFVDKTSVLHDLLLYSHLSCSPFMGMCENRPIFYFRQVCDVTGSTLREAQCFSITGCHMWHHLVNHV